MRFISSIDNSLLKQFVRGKSDLKAYKLWKVTASKLNNSIAALQEEFKKGYFDDFGEFRTHKGKLFLADNDLTRENESDSFPPTEFVDKSGKKFQFPLKASAKATLACISFRESARAMTNSWIEAFQQFPHRCPNDCFKIHMVEHKLMSLWPFRSMILNAQKSDPSLESLFLFGNYPSLYKSLSITNRLTSYIFLLDRNSLIRWRACGMATSEEITALRNSHRWLQSVD